MDFEKEYKILLNKNKKLTEKNKSLNKELKRYIKLFKSTSDYRKRTRIGMCKSIFASNTYNARQRNMPKPTYTKEEFIEWMFKQENFERLYTNWVANDYEKDYKPSIDRIDDYKFYTLDNIQLKTWKENRTRSYEDKINGVNNKQSVPVLMINKKGIIEKKFHSISEAIRKTGISNIHLLVKTGKESKGYIFRKLTEVE